MERVTAAEPRLEVRPLTRDDLPALVALAHQQGRNVHRSEYERFLDLEGAHGLVLARDGALLGAVTVIRYFESGFIGPVVLDGGPDAVGLSILLLQQAVEGLQRSGVGLLEAEAADGEAQLLAGLGFAPVRRTLVLERPPAGPTGAAVSTVPMEPHHLLDVGALDASVVGYGRKEFLLALRDGHPEGARVVETAGEASGYVLVRRSRRGYHLGPLVTRDADPAEARALLADALESAAGWPVVALVPESSGLLGTLVEAGFQPVGGLVRMRAGAPGRPAGEPAAPATEWVLGSRLTG